MIRSMFVCLAALLTLSCGDNGGSNPCKDITTCSENFIAGADHDPCMANAPVCQTTAGCTMEENKYIEGDFPGFVNFVVTTPVDTTIVVKIFFKTRGHPGEDTEINWFEPGCHDSYTYESMGADVFDLAGEDRVFIQEQTVLQEGLHRVDIYSDANTHYYLRVELK